MLKSNSLILKNLIAKIISKIKLNHKSHYDLISQEKSFNSFPWKLVLFLDGWIEQDNSFLSIDSLILIDIEINEMRIELSELCGFGIDYVTPMKKELLSIIEKKHPEYFDFIVNNLNKEDTKSLICFVFKFYPYKEIELECLAKIDTEIKKLAGDIFGIIH